MQSQLPKAQWDIVSQQTFEPVRPYQFAAIFVPPPEVATTTLVSSADAASTGINPNSTPKKQNVAYGLFSTLRTANIPSVTIPAQTDNVQGSPIYYANKLDAIPTFQTAHREYQGWYAYRSIWTWARQAYNFAQMTIGYQYEYKGGVIILNTPSFQGEMQVQQTLLNTQADQLSLAQSLIYDEFWVFVNAWPTTTPTVGFDYSGTNLLNFEVTWQSDRILNSTELYHMQADGQDFSKEIPVKTLSTIQQYLLSNISQ